MINIIIPCYDNEKLLERALASIVAQTAKNKCIVTVVEDSKEEKMKSVIDNFNLPIKYLCKEHEGSPGLTRNFGLERSDCDYVMFLDQDDTLLPRAMEILSREINICKPDILVSNFIVDLSQKGSYKMEKERITWLHGKVYRREFLEKNNIIFPKTLNEDSAFNLAAFYLSEDTRYIDEDTYLWINNKESITRKDSHFFEKCLPSFVESIQFGIDIVKSTGKNVNSLIARYIPTFYEYYEYLSFYDLTLEAAKAFNCINNFLKHFNVAENIDDLKIHILNKYHLLGLDIEKPFIHNRTITQFLYMFHIDLHYDLEELKELKLKHVRE